MRRSKAGLTSADIGKAQQTWWGGKKYIIAAQVDLDIDRLHAHLSAREQIASKRQRKLTRLPAGSHAIWQYNAVGFCVGKLMQACIDLGMQSLRGSGGLGTSIVPCQRRTASHRFIEVPRRWRRFAPLERTESIPRWSYNRRMFASFEKENGSSLLDFIEMHFSYISRPSRRRG